jgi:hypothetical protein
MCCQKKRSQSQNIKRGDAGEITCECAKKSEKRVHAHKKRGVVRERAHARKKRGAKISGPAFAALRRFSSHVHVIFSEERVLKKTWIKKNSLMRRNNVENCGKHPNSQQKPGDVSPHAQKKRRGVKKMLRAKSV